ncbi:MAG TPA: hypothetical protein VJT31_29450 [Rugosimonospora sp.]|nr:hypothetical protein [Rugosimonospora sp.]
MGFARRHGWLVLSYAVLAGLGVFGGRQLALANNSANEPHPFTIASSTVAGITPGRQLTFPVTVTNPASQDVRLLTLSTRVTLLASPPAPAGAPACDASKLTVAPYDYRDRGARPYVIPARGKATVPLTIKLADTTTNQNGCKGRKFTLTYSGTAEQTHEERGR